MRRIAFAAILAAVVVGGALLWTRTAAPPPAMPPPPPAANAPAPETKPPAAAREVTLYLAREKSTGSGEWVLVPVHRASPDALLKGPAAEERASLDALLKGPTAEEKAKGFLAPLPEGTLLLGVKKEDGVVTADFSRELQQKFNGGAEWEEVVLYSIVNTLSDVEGTDAVRIRVDGAPVESIGGHLDAGGPLRRNNEIVDRGNG